MSDHCTEKPTAPAASPESPKAGVALVKVIDTGLRIVPMAMRLLYFVLVRIFYAYFRIAYHFEVRGKHNIPEEGAIFLVNHQSMLDGFLFLSAIQKPVAVLGDVREPTNTLLVKFLHMVPRRGTRESMVRRMAQVILYKNRNFAIWPTGTLERGAGQMYGFSSIARVYAIVNADRDRVPFVPVYLESAPTPDRPRQIRMEYLPKLYIPRPWLKAPAQGGKTPRQIIDAVLLVLARHRGQSELAPNPLLEKRRKSYQRPWA